jgi:hypothetical protein
MRVYIKFCWGKEALRVSKNQRLSFEHFARLKGSDGHGCQTRSPHVELQRELVRSSINLVRDIIGRCLAQIHNFLPVEAESGPHWTPTSIIACPETRSHGDTCDLSLTKPKVSSFAAVRVSTHKEMLQWPNTILPSRNVLR